ncbi:enoyl-CoA hydratase/isomerase family protein [Microvirga sp. 3-52]|jgi:2-(1,2-epoxy-1,2-dihydrophenyl)acetyl-CoA isomerase|uniref:enoyl-CoA hydratase-related protein n=1 Tax=Microvirga sp. 3-52 TaxID=2792425 RepID=UPI001AD5D0D1|nr:enoyl-CoA hydratase-related protein [Microvirga sp. 3-52]MBO1905100.1 enoyl-CoA hydratase/isomerase family protein [Microvirga sp. 3-52]MBS7452907.1 enoyl-CoA hydratase/isomerase family protein [Microvirga sp. 3-52]
MSPTTLRCTVDGPVATITLARPERMNAFNAAMHADLRDALDQCERDESVRVVVLTGEGRAFSSGQDLTVDLKRDEEGRIDLGPALTRDYNPLVLRLSNYPKPIIAALNGPAVGASMNIALACDIIVAARSAYLQEAFSKIGLIPDAGGTWILPRLVGPKQALALMLSAEAVSAEDAQRMGLVYKVFDDASFAVDVAAFAGSLAAGPGLAYRLTKQAVAQSLANDLETQLDLEARLQAEAGSSDDFMEGVAAFREKRAPRFSGR